MIAALIAAWAAPLPAASDPEAASGATDQVLVTRVSAEPDWASGVLWMLIALEGATGAGQRTYFLTFFERGQPKPHVGEICALTWKPFRDSGITGDGAAVTEGRLVTAFACRPSKNRN